MKLYELGLNLLEKKDDFAVKMLRFQVFNLKMSSDFVIQTEKEVAELVDFLNTNHIR
ncbi:MAG: hypothetical protein Q8862_11545 [Bacteroidota bacterium]|nr:hypothetical protein [Bacteroidota bacterium]MDP4205832.1 hypothetical protein [Bacteroidota bacterium]